MVVRETTELRGFLKEYIRFFSVSLRKTTNYKRFWKSISDFFQCPWLRPTGPKQKLRNYKHFQKYLQNKQDDKISDYKTTGWNLRQCWFLTMVVRETTELRGFLKEYIRFFSVSLRKTTELRAFLKEHIRFFSVSRAKTNWSY